MTLAFEFQDTQDLDAQAGPSNAPAAPESSALQAYHAIADDLTRYMAEHGKAQETLKSDPDMAGSSRPAAGKSANSRSSSNADALALMPTIPAPTSGLVSPDDASLQQQPGYGESSSTSDSDSESSEEEEDEQAAAAAPQEEEEVQGPEVPNHAMADPDGEEDQAAVSSSSSSVSSSSSDEEAVEQQPAHEGEHAKQDSIHADITMHAFCAVLCTASCCVCTQHAH